MLVAALCVAEGIARTLQPFVPTWQPHDNGAVVMVGHPTRLWGMAEGVRENITTTATIDALGLRGDLPELPRPSGRERVLILGDSSFFGHGVADDETPAEQLRARLLAAGLDADVVNGAVPGYSTEQSRRLLDEVGWSLQPTLLVVCNLWSDFNFDHYRDADLLRTQATFAHNPLAGSAAFQLLAGVVDRIRGGTGAHVVTWTRHSTWPEGGVRRVPVQDYARNLDSMIRAARDHGAGAVLLLPTNRDMARGDSRGEDVRRPYVDAQAQVAAWHGLPVVATLGPFRAAAAQGGADALFLDDLHPSARGDGVVAQAIFDTLRAAGWPTTKLLGREDAFDASGLHDAFPEGRSDVPPDLSAQVNLFPTQAASSPAPTATAPTGGWTVTGTLDAPPGPVEIVARGPDGAKVAETVLRRAGPFTLAVPDGVAAVHVTAQGATGQADADASPGAAPLRLTLGG